MSDTPPPVPPVPPAGGATPPPEQPAAPPAQPAYPAYGQAAPGYYAPPTNTLAIVALVLSFLVSIAGVICGHIALGQIKRTGEGGRGLAIAALVIGYVFLGIGLLVIIFYVGLFAVIASSGFATYNY